MKLLLHSCCGPCSSSVIERLRDNYDITVLYYNPNIEPKDEYLKRKTDQINYLQKIKIPYLEIDYLNEEFKNYIKGFEKEIEKGKRCTLCFELRLLKTAEIAKKNHFNYFTTTLTVSPHKDSNLINELGRKIADIHEINYLVEDFKKKGGYQRSMELVKQHNLYRQNYCGCRYSKRG